MRSTYLNSCAFFETHEGYILEHLIHYISDWAVEHILNKSQDDYGKRRWMRRKNNTLANSPKEVRI